MTDARTVAGDPLSRWLQLLVDVALRYLRLEASAENRLRMHSLFDVYEDEARRRAGTGS